MKQLKLIAALLLLVIGFLFNGELSILYFDDFENSYYQSRIEMTNLTDDIDVDEIIQDFTMIGEEYDVDFFFVENRNESTFIRRITIYGTSNAINHLKKNGISDREYGSLFMGKTIVDYKDLHSASEIEKFEYCYYIGDETKEEDFRFFKSSLMEKYGGTLPKLLGSDRYTFTNLFSVWTIIFGIILMMSIYEMVTKKKEVMLRIILGEDVRMLFLKSAMIDSIAFSIMFFSLPFLLNSVSYSYFKFSYTSIMFLLFIILNFAINSSILQINFKKNLSKMNNGNRLLSINYVIKTITTIMTIVILSGNIAIITQGYDMYKQRDFFEAHSDYSYFRLNYKLENNIGKTIDDDILMNQIFYQRFQENSLQYINLTDNYESPYPVILINKGSILEIETENNMKIPTTEEKVYLVLPSRIAIDSEEHFIAEQIHNVFFENSSDSKAEILEYEEDIDLIGIHLDDMKYNSTWMDRPIIILDNTVQKYDPEIPGADPYYTSDIMYNISESDFQKFIDEFQLKNQIVSISNVLEVYEHNWGIMLRNMLLTIILSIFLLLIELILIFVIIKMEYQFNADEMAIKKVMGYTLIKRNMRIIKITLVCSIISMLCAVVLSKQFANEIGINLLYGGALLLVMEILVIVFKAKNVEKRAVTAILKGAKI